MSTGRSGEVSRRSKVEIKQFMLEAARTLTHSLTFIVNEVIPVDRKLIYRGHAGRRTKLVWFVCCFFTATLSVSGGFRSNVTL